MPTAGGKLIESTTVATCRLKHGFEVVRLWVVDVYSTREPMLADEHCVYVVRGPRMPELGEHVSWRDGTVWFGDDECKLVRVGASHPAPGPVGDP